MPPQPPQVFQSEFEALFPHTETLGCAVCLVPQLFLPVYLHVNVRLPSLQSAALPTNCNLAYLGPPAAALPEVLSAWLPISIPPTGLDECFFFNSLVVRLPYSSIFCEFWLVFVFKFVLSFFWLCEEVECVSLCLHVGWKSFHPFWNQFLYVV